MHVQWILTAILAWCTSASRTENEKMLTIASTTIDTAPNEVRHRLVCIGTLGAMRVGSEHLDSFLDTLAAWGEAQDLTWIE